MSKHFLISKVSLGVILMVVGATGWWLNGHLVFIAFLLWGLMKFFGSLLYILTGKTPFNSYRNLMYFLIAGAILGFVAFDLPGIYLFKVWTYQEQIPNPFDNFPMYAVQTLGWGVFFVIFYDSFKLMHLALDKNFHAFGFTHHKGSYQKIFSYIGLIGVLLFLISIIMAVAKFQEPADAWVPTMGAFGLWFMLENIEFRRTGRSLLLSTLCCHFTPILSILAGSLVLGFVFEYLNIISPRQHWVYSGLPYQDFNVLGLPVFLLLSWSWMYIIFLSIYAIIYKKEKLWD